MSIARYYKLLSDKGDINETLFTPRAPAFERVQFLVTRLEQLNKMRSQENNRLSASLDKAAARSISSMLTFIDKQIERKKEITRIVQSRVMC